ncbi:MAG TPA: type II secretion system protein GspM [Terriglobia bacterium]|nr:type II secretion system protein GspM [Terriglobia bacterium]
MLKNLQPRERVAITVAAAGVGLFLVLQFLVLPLLDRLPKTAGDTENKELTLQRYQRLVRESVVEQSSLTATRERLKVLESGLLESPSASLANAEWQRLVRELADAQGVELGSSEFLRTEDLGGGYSLIVGRAQLRCPMDKLVSFMIALANSPKVMSVTKMRLLALQGDPQKRLSLEITVGAPIYKSKLANDSQGQKN